MNDIFNEVRYRQSDMRGSGRESTVVPVSNLMIRLDGVNKNGYFIIAERTFDDSDFFQIEGYVIGPVETDEYGIRFKCILSDKNTYEVVVTRKGIY